jgi:hypothetical protein
MLPRDSKSYLLETFDVKSKSRRKKPNQLHKHQKLLSAIADLPGRTPGRRQRCLAVIRDARALEGDVSLRKKAFDGRLKKPFPFG